MTRPPHVRLRLAGLLLGAVIGCRPPASEPPARPLVIGTGGQGGAYYPISEALSEAWAASVPGLRPALQSGGSGQNVDAVEAGTADVAFTQADVAYAAYRRGTTARPSPFTDLRGIAVLWSNTLHVAVPRVSDARRLADLRDRRLVVGGRGTGTETLAAIVMGGYGLTYDDVRPDFANFTRGIEALRAGTTDAAMVVAGIPADAVVAMARDPGVRLLPVPRTDVQRMRARFPFLEPALVPAGTYAGQTQDLETVGVRNLLVCRANLPEDLVQALTASLFEALPALSARHPAGRLIDVAQAPATPIPLHPGAARYYRARELTR